MSKYIPAAARILADPTIQKILATERELKESKDIRALGLLFGKIHSRKPRQMRRHRFNCLRDPRDLAFRWLRRFVGGEWYRGGSHVARYNGGPGIGFTNFRNDRAVAISAVLIRC